MDKKFKDLESCIDTLSIEDAIKAVKLATYELEKLKETKRNAEEKVRNALIDVEKSTKKKDELEKKLSSSHQYSDASFWDDRYKETLNLNDNDNSKTYEWYVSFNDIKFNIDRDISSLDYNSNKFSIMVSGCGNSSLCEDLETNGYDNIIGTDYSKEVITFMTKRANDLNYKCKYIVTDLCNMKNINSATYKIIIDKGTLDAISSANDINDTNKSLASAYAYIREVWRILIVQGKLIIITTMTKDIFESIAISALDYLQVSNWENCTKENLKTQVGENVYYYCITKTSENKLSQRFQKDVLIKALLDDAVKARNEYIYSNAESLEFEDGGIHNNNEIGSLPTSTSISIREPLVFLNIRNENITIQAKTVIEIEYILRDGDWHEYDQICLVSIACNENKNIHLYRQNETQKYECFTYSNKPKKNDSSCIELKGHISITLPPYGGCFVITYIRNVQGNGIKELARSSRISILCPVQYSHPDIKSNHSIQRRGVGDMNSKNQGTMLNVIVENLKNIKCLQISGMILVNDPKSSFYLGRIMSWLYQLVPDDLFEWKLVFESDILQVHDNSNVECDDNISIKTIYGKIIVKGINVTNLLLQEAYSEIDTSGRIVCRIPYKSHFEDTSYCTENKIQKVDSSNYTEIHCKYCSQLLMNANIFEIRHLPSGLLDNMMHEFFCCEEMPLQAMSSSELKCNDSSMIIGSIQTTVHPNNIKRNSILISCKITSTLIDLIHGYAGILATSKNKIASSHSKRNDCKMCFSRCINAIDTDTCLISCSRCLSYLGDGCIYADDNNSNDDDVESSSFFFNDLQSIRFLLHRITINGNFRDLSTENVLARILIHFINAYR